MASQWNSKEAFLSDLWSFSEIEQPTDQEEEFITPASIQEFTTRIGANNNPSIFESQFVTDDAPFVYSGRGRGARSTLIRPGGPNPDEDIMKQLREVSGLGYSNELIVQNFKAETNQLDDIPTPEIKPQPVPSTSATATSLSSTSRSTPSSMSNVSSPTSSRNCSICVTPSKSEVNNLSSSNGSSRSSTPPSTGEIEPAKVAEKAPHSNPLPLSVMLSQARIRRAKENLNNGPKTNGLGPIKVWKAKENPKEEPEKNEGLGQAKIGKAKRSPGKEPENNEGLVVRENGENTSRSLELNVNAPEWTPNRNHNGSDYWWNRGPETTNDETNSWRRRDTNSPPRFFAWNSDFNKSKNFNITSSKDFPPLK